MRASDKPTLSEALSCPSVWRPASIQQEPMTRLTNWMVMKVLAQDECPESIHFIGWAGYEGRVCSAVQEFDKSTMKGRTQSGRIYELVGPPGCNRDALHVWGFWIQNYGNPPWEEVTGEYYDEPLPKTLNNVLPTVQEVHGDV